MDQYLICFGWIVGSYFFLSRKNLLAFYGGLLLWLWTLLYIFAFYGLFIAALFLGGSIPMMVHGAQKRKGGANESSPDSVDPNRKDKPDVG
jgi:predicted membrane protein